MKPSVLVTDGLDADGMAILENSGFRPVLKKGLDREAFVAELQSGAYGAIILRSATKHLKPGAIDETLASALHGVRTVVRQGVGVDNLDIPELSRLGVIVQNTAGSNNESVAQLVFSFIHHFFDSVAPYSTETRTGAWTKGSRKRRELRGSRIGIVGLGHIGARVAELAKAWGMDVRGFDLNDDACDTLREQLGISIAAELPDIFDSDIVTLHVPGTEKTRGMVTEELVQRIPAGGVFINTSRAFIADEQMLYRVARRRREEGAPLCLALDVFAEERALPEARIPEDLYDVACLVPHMGASTPESQKRGSVTAARQVVDVLSRGVVVNALNCPRLEEDSIPFVELGDRLTTLARRFFRELPDKVEFTLYGEAAGYEAEVALGMKAGMLRGDGRPLTERIASADYLFRREGLVAERREPDRRKESSPAYERAVTIDLVAETGDPSRVSVRGRINYLRQTDLQRIDVYGNAQQKHPAVRSYAIEFPLEGNLLVLELARDVKAALGATCTYLGMEMDRDILRTGQSVHDAGTGRPPTALFVLRLDRPLDAAEVRPMLEGAVKVPQHTGDPVPLRMAAAFPCVL